MFRKFTIFIFTLLVLVLSEVEGQDLPQQWFFTSGTKTTLTAKSDTVLIGGNLPIGTVADTANTMGTIEIFMGITQERFMYSGNTQLLSFDIKDASVITMLRVRIWHDTLSPNNTAFRSWTKTATSENLGPLLVNGTNNITLSTPLPVQEGDCYSIQYTASDSGISLLWNFISPITGGPDSCRYKTSFVTDTVGKDWHLETATFRHFPIKFYSSPAPVIVMLGNSMIDGNPFWQSGVSTYPLSWNGAELRQTIGYRMAKYTGWTVFNMGIGGNTTAQILARVSQAVAEKPAFMWIEPGLNDPAPYVGNATALSNKMKQLVDSCVFYNIPFGFNRIGDYNGKTNATNFLWDTVNSIMQPYVLSKGGIWCDMREFMSLESDSVGAPAGNDWLLNPYYGVDIVHYNDTGKSVWLWKLLRSMRAKYVIPNDTMTFRVVAPTFDWNNTTANIGMYDQFTHDSAHVNITRTSTGTSWYAAFSTLTTNNAYTKIYSFNFKPYLDSIYGTNDILTYTISGYGKSGSGTYTSTFQNWGYGLVPELTTDSSAVPVRIYASSQAATFEKWKAFDANITTASDCWATNIENTGWMMVDFGIDTTVTFYSIIGRGAGLGFDFKDWTLSGSADSLSWIIVDTQTDVTTWTTLEHRTYTLSSPATYRYWKWNITENQGGAYTEAVQLQLYGY